MLTLSGYTHLHDVIYRPTSPNTNEKSGVSVTSLRPPSYAHHPSLSALTDAATAGCSLCKMILDAVEDMSAEVASLKDTSMGLPRVPDFEQGFWVTGRVNRGKGVVVWTGGVDERWKSESSLRGRWIFPVVALGVCIEKPEHAGQGLEVRVGGALGDSTFTFLRRRLEICQGQGHEDCTKNDGNPRKIPPGPESIQLIDVGTNDNEVRLVIANQQGVFPDVGKNGYVAFSYSVSQGAQGRAIAYRTLTGDRSDAASLPTLFRDAVTFTRRLGYRYLWIDMVCIPEIEQETVARRRHSEYVASIYRHAALTLAASDATDVGHSLFKDRPDRMAVEVPWVVYAARDSGIDGGVADTESSTVPVQDFMTDAERLTQQGKDERTPEVSTPRTVKAFTLPIDCETIHSYYVSLRHTPLAHRAWSFAERVLSRRVIHVAGDQVYFECLGTDPRVTGHDDEEDKLYIDSTEKGMFVSEDGVVLRHRSQSIYHGAVARILFRPGDEYTDAERTDVQNSWHGLVRTYSQHVGTETPADRLAAMAPLARIYGRVLLGGHSVEPQKGYIVGHFRRDLTQSLCWQGLGMQGSKAKKRGLNITALQELDAPSWSWASFPGTTAGSFTFYDAGQIHELATLVDFSSSPVHEGDPFGAAKPGAWLEIQAPAVELEVVPRQDVETDGMEKWMRLRSKTLGEGEGNSAGLDLISREYDEAIKVVGDLKLWAVVLVKVTTEVDQSACEDGGCRPLPVDYRSLIVTEADWSEDSGAPRLRRLGWMFHGDDFFVDGELDKKVTMRLM